MLDGWPSQTHTRQLALWQIWHTHLTGPRSGQAEFIWWACGIAVRFPQRLVAKTFAPNVEVEVVMARFSFSVHTLHREDTICDGRGQVMQYFSRFFVKFTESLESSGAKRAGRRPS